jgi:hypothetical protein
MRFDSGSVNIPSAGTAVQVSNTRHKVLWIKFKALAANTGLTFVGLSDVSSSNGYELGAGGDIDGELELDFRLGAPGSVGFNVFYVDAAENGEDVTWAAIFQ